MDTPHTWSAWLKRLRADRDVTQEQLARRVGCSAQTIGAFEVGRRRPSRSMAERLADVLNVDPGQRAEFVRLARTSADPVSLAGHEALAVAPGSVELMPSSAGSRRPMRLPTSSTLLIGRVAEAAELCRLLTNASCRLVTLAGAGGTGKTRLALQVAGELAGQFPDGVAWIALAPIQDPEHVASALVDALGCPRLPSETSEAAALRWLRDRTLLLVLDNLEHLLPATPLLATIMRDAPRVRLLVTSRERLHLGGEWIFSLGGLALPVDDSWDAIDRSDAVVLFRERARKHAWDFALTSANRLAIAQICRLLDGMPLGIELAAAWVRVLEPAEIVAELTRSLDFLQGSDRDVDPRHRSMRAVIEHSWALLTPDEQGVIARLGVFRGGCHREAAEAVAGATLPMLAALLDKSLLRRSAGPGDIPRYDLHELVRQYAAEQLQSTGIAQATAQQHARYYLSLAEEAAPRFFGSEQATWFLWLDQEINNLRAAMRFLLDHADWEGATRLNWALWRFWWVRGYAAESRRWAEEVLHHAPAPGLALSPLCRAQALLVAGSMAWAAGEYDEGFRQCAASVELSQQAGDRRTEAVGLMMAGMNSAVLLGDDNHARTRAYLERSSRVFQAIQQNWGAAFALSYLGMIVLEHGSYAEALGLLEQAYQLARTTGDDVTTHQVVLNLGLATETQGDSSRAACWFAEGLRLVANAHDVGNAGYFIKGLAEVAIRQGHIAAGTRLLGGAVALLELVGAPIHRHPLIQTLYEHVVAEARSRLGPAAWAQHWSAGRRLSAADALAEAQRLAPVLGGGHLEDPPYNCLSGLRSAGHSDPSLAG